MGHLFERAKTGRAKCRGCGKAIAGGETRFGERLPNPFDDNGGELTHWFHVPCAAFLRPDAFLEALPAAAEPIADRERLDAQARLGVTHRRLPRATAVARASSGRATCRSCRQAIGKDTWRIALVYNEEGRFVPSGFIHLECALPYLETLDVVERLRYFSPEVREAEWREIADGLAAPPRPAADTGSS